MSVPFLRCVLLRQRGVSAIVASAAERFAVKDNLGWAAEATLAFLAARCCDGGGGNH